MEVEMLIANTLMMSAKIMTTIIKACPVRLMPPIIVMSIRIGNALLLETVGRIVYVSLRTTWTWGQLVTTPMVARDGFPLPRE
jgi:hypothetical protein